MKHFFFSLLAIGLSTYAQAQAPTIQWQKAIGGTNTDGAHYISPTADGGYLVTGQSMSNDGDVTGNHGGYDMWVAKVSGAGSLLWQKALGSGMTDDGWVIMETPEDGGSIVAGYSSGNTGDVTGNHGFSDMWLVKLSATGSVMWQKSYGGSSYEEALAMIRTSDGGYVLAGFTRSADGDVTFNNGNSDCWIVKVNSVGTMEWQKSYGGTGYDRINSIVQTADGGYMAVSQSNSNDGDVSGNHGNNDYWVFKVSATGALVWQKCFGGTDSDNASEIIKSSDGGYVITGTSRSSDGDVMGHHTGGVGLASDVWTVKIDASGTIIWENSAGGYGDDYGYSVVETGDMGYVVAGHVWSNDGDVVGNHGGTDNWIFRLSPTGMLQWQKPMGGTTNDGGARMCKTKDGGYAIAGQATSNDGDVTGVHGAGDYWIVKLSCDYTVGAVTASAALCVGASVTLTAVTPGGTWQASNSNASVTGGVVTGMVPGVDTIEYTVINTCGSPVKYSSVTVNALPVATIASAGSTLSTTTPFITYQWLLGGIPIAGATGATHSAILTGTYEVIVTNAAGCSDTSVVFVYTGATGVQGVEGNAVIRIVPNPTSGNISIAGVNAVNVRVYNYMGQLLKTVNNTNTLSVAELPAGVYLAAILDEHNNLLQQERFIKN